MYIDHIFIFTDDKGKVADQLVSFGLTEGESRVHQGQGTTNRTFVFGNFYLEILWVHNAQEIESEFIRPTGLYRRALFTEYDCSPFGLCMANTDETGLLFKNAFKYQPDYFPDGMTIDILNNDDNPDLPWTFKLPFKREREKKTSPTGHKNGMNVLTMANFQYTDKKDRSFLGYFENEAIIQFTKADKVGLILTFDNGIRGLTKQFEELKLTIQY